MKNENLVEDDAPNETQRHFESFSHSFELQDPQGGKEKKEMKKMEWKKMKLKKMELKKM